jgi:hypothetical protein
MIADSHLHWVEAAVGVDVQLAPDQLQMAAQGAAKCAAAGTGTQMLSAPALLDRLRRGDADIERSLDARLVQDVDPARRRERRVSHYVALAPHVGIIPHTDRRQSTSER